MEFLKSLFTFVLFLACIGAPAAWFLMPKDLGITPLTPLGEFEKIEAWMDDNDYVMTAEDWTEELSSRFKDEVAGARVFKFAHLSKREFGYAREFRVILDAQGVVRAIAADFLSGTDGNDEPELMPSQLAWRFWEELAGRKPSFMRTTAADQMYDGYDGYMHVDSFAADGIKGSWIKKYVEPANEDSLFDSVEIYTVGG